MADAKKCDRCERYYDRYFFMVKNSVHSYPISKIKLGDLGGNVYFEYDVCPKCMKEFFGFIRMPYELIESEVEM